MSNPPIGGDGKQEKEILQTRPTPCPSVDDLELYFCGKSPLASIIQAHIEGEECLSCSAYLALRERIQRSADEAIEGFLRDIEKDARAHYASICESLAGHQNTDDPRSRQTAAHQRYALGVPTFQIEFRAEQRRLQLHWEAEDKLNYEDYTFCYGFRITGFDREAGEETFTFQVELKDVLDARGVTVDRRPAHWPDPKRFGADLLLADDKRLPLTMEEGTEKGEPARWASPRITSKELPLRAGERLFRIESFALQLHRESAESHDQAADAAGNNYQI